MKTIACACLLTVLAFPVSASDPPGFALWRASDLKGHDAALSKHLCGVKAEDGAAEIVVVVLKRRDARQTNRSCGR